MGTSSLREETGPAFEHACLVTRDPNPYPGEVVAELTTYLPEGLTDEERSALDEEVNKLIEHRAVQLAMTLVRDVSNGIIETCRNHPSRMFIFHSVLAGHSYSETGALLGITKQGVAKHVSKICEANPILGPLIGGHTASCGFASTRQPVASTEERAMVESLVVESERALHAIHRGDGRKNQYG